MKRLILLAAAAALAGCTTVSAAPGNSGSAEQVARIGRSVTVNGLRIRPVAVVEDSRCPMNARCVWAGRIIVRVALGGGVTRDLTLGETSPHGGGRLALVSAEPNRMAGAPAPQPRDYRFVFTYER